MPASEWWGNAVGEGGGVYSAEESVGAQKRFLVDQEEEREAKRPQRR